MPQMTSTYEKNHAIHDLICALQNPTPAGPLVKLGNGHTEALMTSAEISRKANPQAVPTRVPFRGASEEKLQQVNLERSPMKIASQ